MLGQETFLRWVIQPKDCSDGYQYVSFKNENINHVEDVMNASRFLSKEEASYAMKDLEKDQYNILGVFFKTSAAIYRPKKL